MGIDKIRYKITISEDNLREYPNVSNLVEKDIWGKNQVILAMIEKCLIEYGFIPEDRKGIKALEAWIKGSIGNKSLPCKKEMGSIPRTKKSTGNKKQTTITKVTNINTQSSNSNDNKYEMNNEVYQMIPENKNQSNISVNQNSISDIQISNNEDINKDIYIEKRNNNEQDTIGAAIDNSNNKWIGFGEFE